MLTAQVLLRTNVTKQKQKTLHAVTHAVFTTKKMIMDMVGVAIVAQSRYLDRLIPLICISKMSIL